MSDTGKYSNELLKRLSEPLARELLGICCEDRLGHGLSREVFRFGPDYDCVIKFEVDPDHFQNVAEWQVWERVQHTKHAKWFAPCVRISHCGRILIQKFATPIASIALPAEVPVFFTDLKPGNWGVYDKHPVAVDYGKHLLMERGMSSKMKRADWS